MTKPSDIHSGDTLTLQSMQKREAAMREILQAISQSHGDYGPIFDMILENATELCDAPLAFLFLANQKRTHLDLVRYWGKASRDYIEFFEGNPIPLDAELAGTSRSVIEKKVFQIKDLREGNLYRDGQPHRVWSVDVEGIRTVLMVPLISGGTGIGVLALWRREAKPFDDNNIELVETFAEQAVIGIEKVRQFRELQNRLEQQAATSEILEVISRSRDDEQPVFDVILENATRLCDAPLAYLHLCNEERTRMEIAAHSGTRTGFIDFVRDHPLPLDGTQSASARAVLEMTAVQTEDLANDPLYQDKQPHRVQAVDVEGMRTLLSVPLIAGDKAIGIIALYRREVRAFDERQIELVRTFAAQAVIAIENVRQFRALESLNAELGDRVEEQVGEIERMGRLKRFLSPAVADAVVSSGDDKLLSSHRALIAVMFCDIRGFTAFCETAEPEEAIEVLQTYHEEMGELINEHGAGVDHRSGDGIMVIFNDPLPCDDPADSALKLAIAMRDEMAHMCDDWRKLGYRLGFGIGISLGYATVGVVGSAGRYEYTASGTAVNLAARLCDEAGDGEILLSPRAYRAVEDKVVVESAGELTLKGIQAPVEAVRLIKLKDAKAPSSGA